LTVCGDYIRDISEYTTPLEAAALSGLEAGERTASFFQQQEELLHKQWKEPSEHRHLLDSTL
jgi:hypothetical protein